MGIERNGRKPKRRRTTAQRMKGRMQQTFQLPEPPAEQAEAPKPKKKAAKAEE